MTAYTPLHHGITVRDAALMCGVSEGTVRSWLTRYDLPRTKDGQICPFGLMEWWDTVRNTDQAKRRGWRAA